jgi:hypothetical protein
LEFNDERNSTSANEKPGRFIEANSKLKSLKKTSWFGSILSNNQPATGLLIFFPILWIQLRREFPGASNIIT